MFWTERRNFQSGNISGYSRHDGSRKVNGEDDEVSRQDAQRAAGEEAPEIDALAARERCEELPADQVTAQDEEEIDADPAETDGTRPGSGKPMMPAW